MNLKEFAALKVGDRVENAMTGSTGEIIEVRDRGVVLSWGGNHMQHFFSVQSTAWFHWSRAESVDQLQSDINASNEKIVRDL